MLIVQKYGGATLADPEKIRSAAQRIFELRQQGHSVVAIVSAMGQTTNQLIELAQKISAQPNRRELDMLLSTGERVSMALLSMALHDLGCAAISFTGSQAGIFTDDSHVNAFITDVRAFRVADSLKEGKVVVQAGFQGVSPQTKEITTLGRGGTDTTAVAMTVYLKGDHCEILKDVPAIFSADPKVISNAKMLRELTYDQLAHMCFWGAKVLHYRSAELALRNKIKLYIGPAAHSAAEGTWITERTKSMYESAKVISLNSHETVLALRSKMSTAAETFKLLEAFLTKNQMAWPQILTTKAIEQGFEVLLTGPSELTTAIKKFIPQEPGLQLGREVSTVTATCSGVTSQELLKGVLQKLEGFKFQSLEFDSMGFTVEIAQENRIEILKSLHLLV